jgi:hypothetical protein
MMGLADRVGPWARRFQGAAAGPVTGRRDDDADGRAAARSAPPPAAASDDDAVAAAEPADRSGRFVRRAAQKR